MDMSGDQWVPLAREEVWKALNDAEVLKACIPGCEGVEKTSDTAFTATVNAKVGPVKSRFKGDVTLSDMDPPNSYRLNFQGQGAAGFTKGSADVKLTEEAEGTRIAYSANATVGGKLAQVGARLVDGAARKMANDFFSNLTERLGGKAGEGPAQADQGGETPQGGGAPPSGASENNQQARAEQAPDERASAGAEPAAGAGAAASPEAASSSAPQGTKAPPGPPEQGSNRVLLWVVLAVVIAVIVWLILR